MPVVYMTYLEEQDKVGYDMRIQNLDQPKETTTAYGLRTFLYLESKLKDLFCQRVQRGK